MCCHTRNSSLWHLLSTEIFSNIQKAEIMFYWKFPLEEDDASKEKHPEVRMCQSRSSALSTCLWCSLQPQHAAASGISGETLLSESFRRLRFVFTCHNASLSKADVFWVGETLTAGQQEVLEWGEQPYRDPCWLQPQRPRWARSSVPCVGTDGQVRVMAQY